MSGFGEPPVAWRKSSHSDSGGCVELTSAGGSVLVRDSRNRSGTVLRFGPATWSAFVEYARGTDPGPGSA